MAVSCRFGSPVHLMSFGRTKGTCVGSGAAPGGSLTVTLALCAKASVPRPATTAARRIVLARERIRPLLLSVLLLRVLLRLRHQFLQHDLIFRIHRVLAAAR